VKKIFQNFSIFLVCIITCSSILVAQSRDQNFPTAVTTNENDGTIKPREIGDSRITSYYYAFDGNQGDIFVNVVTKNFNGDIDVFIQDGLRSLTKMVIYADTGMNETGRLIYLRKEEKLLLRIQGRTPNDDPATFRIKLGGSFVALKPQKEEAAPVVDPEADKSKTVVNSVGTIVEVRPKSPPPTKTESVKEKEQVQPKVAAAKESKPPDKAVTAPKNDGNKKPEVVVEKLPDETPKVATAKTEKPAKPLKITPPKAKPPVVREEKKPDPLANIRLVIQMKDGTFIERPMSEVQKFSVDKGILTVIGKNGAVSKFSILDVTKVTIE